MKSIPTVAGAFRITGITHSLVFSHAAFVDTNSGHSRSEAEMLDQLTALPGGPEPGEPSSSPWSAAANWIGEVAASAVDVGDVAVATATGGPWWTVGFGQVVYAIAAVLVVVVSAVRTLNRILAIRWTNRCRRSLVESIEWTTRELMQPSKRARRTQLLKELKTYNKLLR